MLVNVTIEAEDITLEELKGLHKLVSTGLTDGSWKMKEDRKYYRKLLKSVFNVLDYYMTDDELREFKERYEYSR